MLNKLNLNGSGLNQADIIESQNWNLLTKIPVFVSVALCVLGTINYGFFAVAIAPLFFVNSMFLSNSLSRFMQYWDYRRFSALLIVLLGIVGFCVEAYAAHNGCLWINKINQENGWATISEAGIWGFTISVGLWNIFAHKAYVSALLDLTPFDVEIGMRRRKIRQRHRQLKITAEENELCELEIKQKQKTQFGNDDPVSAESNYQDGQKFLSSIQQRNRVEYAQNFERAKKQRSRQS